MKAIFTLIVLFVIFGTGCKKKESYDDIPDQYKAYFLFKEGSSWIYYNSMIHGNDSMVLRNINSIATKPDNSCSEYRFDYKMQYTSVTTGKLFHSQTNCIKSTDITDGLTAAMLSAPPAFPTMLLDTLWVKNQYYLNVLAYHDTTPSHQVFAAYAPKIGRIKCFEVVNGDTTISYELLRYHVSPY
jgi:hypothetical protein